MSRKIASPGFDLLGTFNFLQQFEIEVTGREGWVLLLQPTTNEANENGTGIEHGLNALTRGERQPQPHEFHIGVGEFGSW